MRHGEIEGSDKKRFVGQIDLPLNSTGMKQAQRWRERLSSVAFAQIVSSDLVRTHETAQIIAKHHNATVRVMPRLREINLGKWDGRPMAAIRRDFPDEWQKRGERIDTFQPPEGESFRQLADRVAPVIENLAAEINGHILIIGHAGVNRVVLCHALGMPLKNLFRLAQDFGALNLIDIRDGKWRVVVMNLQNETVI